VEAEQAALRNAQADLDVHGKAWGGSQPRPRARCGHDGRPRRHLGLDKPRGVGRRPRGLRGARGARHRCRRRDNAASARREPLTSRGPSGRWRGATSPGSAARPGRARRPGARPRPGGGGGSCPPRSPAGRAAPREATRTRASGAPSRGRRPGPRQSPGGTPRPAPPDRGTKAGTWDSSLILGASVLAGDAPSRGTPVGSRRPS
jgi:hypothetical protein